MKSTLMHVCGGNVGRRLFAAVLGLAWLGAVPGAAAAELRVVDDLSAGGSAYDQLADVAVLPDGAVVAVGSTFLEGRDTLKAWAVRVAPDRTIAWELVFLEHFRSRLRAVSPLPGGDVLVAGTYWPDATQSSLAFVARLDPNGRTVWAKAFGGPGNDEAFAIAALGDGGAVVTGFTSLEGESRPVGWAFRVDAAGDRRWEATFDAEIVTDASLLADGDVALAGLVRVGGNAPDLWLARLGPGGERRWEKVFGGAAHDSANAVAATPDNGMVVGGETLSSGSGGADAWLLRVDGGGNLVWDRALGGTATDRIMALDLFDDGRIAATGTTQIAGTDNFDLWTLVLDADGKPLAATTTGGNRDDRGLGVVVTGAKGVVVSGMAQPADAKQLIANGRILFFELP
ncbi:MAG: hypothetical protein GY791_16340 [Alphaproteobacteria bacterium]|nr:hypothetical protein [Alphaproteobacteria bacterium]